MAEQRGLCCYCLSRIRVDYGKMKVEHWHCQDLYLEEQLSYDNLLGACMGSEGQPETMVHFPSDGRITSDDAALDTELNEVLNLNQPVLVQNRKSVVDALKTALDKTGPWKRPYLEQQLERLSGVGHTGELEPFCQVAIYWIKKRLSRP